MISFDGHFRNFSKKWRANEQNENLSSCRCSDVLDDCIHGNYNYSYRFCLYIHVLYNTSPYKLFFSVIFQKIFCFEFINTFTCIGMPNLQVHVSIVND